MESNKGTGFIPNPEVLKRLNFRIYAMERENHKTKKFKDNEMVDKIRKIIVLEVDKDDN